MSRDFTYGMEIELCDIDTAKGLPKGCYRWSNQEYDLIASQGIYRGLPNDPTFKIHTISGELNTKPTSTIQGQVDIMDNIMKFYPEATLNYRIDTHIHIGWPELRTNIEETKKVLTYLKTYGKVWINKLYKATRHPDMLTADFMFYNTNAKIMPDWRYNFIKENASNIEEFLWWHQTDTTGKRNTRMTTRYYVNMFAIKDHGTIEFRAFWPTLDVNIIENYLVLVRDTVNDALSDNPLGLNKIINKFFSDGRSIAKQQEYDHELACAWRFASYPNVGKRMMERWEEFKKLWAEDKERFFQKSWWKEDWAKLS